MARLARIFPLSRLNGATPTHAATSRRLSCPNSGNCARSNCCRARSDSADRAQFGSFSREFLGLIDVPFNEQIELIDLLLDLVDQMVIQSLHASIAQARPSILFHYQEVC